MTQNKLLTGTSLTLSTSILLLFDTAVKLKQQRTQYITNSKTLILVFLFLSSEF